MEDVGGIIGLIVGLAIMIFFLAAYWQIFTKAGQPGWLAIIPIVNVFILIQIAGKEWWWFILLLIPFVNFIAAIMIIHGLSENFGKGIGYTLGLLFLPFIFIPLLAFGGATYQGRKSKAF